MTLIYMESCIMRLDLQKFWCTIPSFYNVNVYHSLPLMTLVSNLATIRKDAELQEILGEQQVIGYFEGIIYCFAVEYLHLKSLTQNVMSTFEALLIFEYALELDMKNLV